MARLTNKQLEIVVDEIYKQVSIPIQQENQELMDNTEVPVTTYHKDKAIYDDLREQIKDLENECKQITGKYAGVKYKGFKFRAWDTMFQEKAFNKHLMKDLVVLKEFPSKEDIERKIILAGSSEIPDLIKKLVAEFKDESK